MLLPDSTHSLPVLVGADPLPPLPYEVVEVVVLDGPTPLPAHTCIESQHKIICKRECAKDVRTFFGGLLCELGVEELDCSADG